MNLAILHHHLNPGGVTRVVENHLRALAELPADARPVRVLLLHGGRTQHWPMATLQRESPFELTQRTVENFDYDLTGRPATAALGKQLHQTLQEAALPPDSTILHWHNHSLGKNASTPLAVSRLAVEGYRLLLQVHDFAEDFRPSNYRYLRRKLVGESTSSLADQLYPQAAHIHYAVLNGRDRSVFLNAGIDSDRIHFLPNPVAVPAPGTDAAQLRATVNSALELTGGDRLLVSPVRGIRRKNIGETLLWSALVPEAQVLVTLAPQNPQERASFERWSALSDELKLPCRLGSPARLPFPDALGAANALLTTSIAEGFGMAFLEAWLLGKPLVGRNLPEITADFTERGLDLSDLYDEVRVPTPWIDKQLFWTQLRDVVGATYQSFATQAPAEDELQRASDAMLANATIDFARLPVALQANVVRRVARSEDDRRQLAAENPHIDLPDAGVERRVATNRDTVARHFSLAKVGASLRDIYANLQQAETSAKINPLPDGREILSTFLSIDRLRAIRVES